jgi:hypothetical protein
MILTHGGVKVTTWARMTPFSVPSMLTQEQAVEIRVMARRGEGVRAIARQLV